MMSSLQVNFGLEKIAKVTGLNENYLEEIEGDLDFFLDQELNNRFLDIDDCKGVAFYAGDNDFLVEAYDTDGNPVAGPSSEVLEQVIVDAVAQINR